jgi:hypothetical protein
MHCCAALLLFICAINAQAQPSASTPDSAQTLTTARKDIEALCAKKMAGRGYSNDGHRKAGAYLLHRYRTIGAQPYAGAGLQSFNFTLNHFTEASLSVDGKKLVYGRDFIASGGTLGGSGTKQLVDVGFGLPGDWDRAAIKGNIAVVREGLPAGHNLPDSIAREVKQDDFKVGAAQYFGAAAIIILQQKLTASFAQVQEPIVVLEALEANWPKSATRVSYDIPARLNTLHYFARYRHRALGAL